LTVLFVAGLFGLDWVVRNGCAVIFEQHHASVFSRQVQERARRETEKRRRTTAAIKKTFIWQERVVNPVSVGGRGDFTLMTSDWRPGISQELPAMRTTVVLAPAASPWQEDDAARINAAIQKAEGPAVIQLEAGSYHTRTTIKLKSNVVLRGRGMRKTILFADAPQSAVVMQGTPGRKDIDVLEGYQPGSARLRIQDTSGINAGDLVRLHFDHVPSSGRSHPMGRYCQMLRLEKVAKDGRLDVDPPIQEVFKCGQAPRIDIIRPIRFAGVEELSIENGPDNRPNNDMLVMREAADCWLARCELSHAYRSLLRISRSKNVRVSGSYLHHAWGYEGVLSRGIYGYGLILMGGSADCLIEDTCFDTLRHAMIVQNGAYRNVFGYNYSLRSNPQQNKDDSADFSAHGGYAHMNLLEGNVLQFPHSADNWGNVGPMQTFFRNRIVRKGILLGYDSHFPAVVGNVFDQGGVYIAREILEAVVSHNVIPANLPPRWVYQEVRYFRRDQQKPVDDQLVRSLYLKSKPEFLANTPWP